MLREEFEHTWQEWSQGHLSLQACSSCGAARLYPSSICRTCASRTFDRVEAEGIGVVHSMTEVPSKSDAPKTVVLVDLAENVRVLGLATQPFAIGEGVRIAPTGEAHGPIVFGPA